MAEVREHPSAEFVERFADVMVAAGMPRMPSRVLAQLTATDAGRLTAGELSKALHASPAAISGAVRYLEQVDLVRRTRERGSRRDHVVLSNDLWYHNVAGRMDLISAWASVMRNGADAIGRDTPAGSRLSESADLFDFVHSELPKILDRWVSQRARRHRRPEPARGRR